MADLTTGQYSFANNAEHMKRLYSDSVCSAQQVAGIEVTSLLKPVVTRQKKERSKSKAMSFTSS